MVVYAGIFLFGYKKNAKTKKKVMRTLIVNNSHSLTNEKGNYNWRNVLAFARVLCNVIIHFQQAIN